MDSFSPSMDNNKLGLQKIVVLMVTLYNFAHKKLKINYY